MTLVIRFSFNPCLSSFYLCCMDTAIVRDEAASIKKFINFPCSFNPHVLLFCLIWAFLVLCLKNVLLITLTNRVALQAYQGALFDCLGSRKNSWSLEAEQIHCHNWFGKHHQNVVCRLTHGGCVSNATEDVYCVRLPFSSCEMVWFIQGGNNISAEGTSHLAAALKDNTTITTVSALYI